MGSIDGSIEGREEGSTEGRFVGSRVGISVGNGVGSQVGSEDDESEVLKSISEFFAFVRKGLDNIKRVDPKIELVLSSRATYIFKSPDGSSGVVRINGLLEL